MCSKCQVVVVDKVFVTGKKSVITSNNCDILSTFAQQNEKFNSA